MAELRARPLILLELNELCPRLMKKFMEAGELPSFSRFHAEAEVATTMADEVAPHLDPWIQWITVHSGVPYRQHRIHLLDQGHKLEAPNLWDLVSARGEKVWVCGSMNLSYAPGIRGWVIPDPWATHVPPTPAELLPYFRFIQANVTEYTSGKVPLSLVDQARFVAFMATHGLSARSAAAVVAQLARERLDPRSYFKRAALLDRLQMDLFKWVYRRERPRFSTFFSNSTAHYQHVYWRNMEPEHFKLKPSPEEQAVYRDAILFGYKQMDRLLGEFMALDPDATLVFCTAFSQQPFVHDDEAGGKTPYRPFDFDQFLAHLDIQAPAQVSPVMSDQFHLEFASEGEAEDAAAKLAAVRYEGRSALYVNREGKRILTGCEVHGRVPDGALLTQGASVIRFYDLFYRIDLLKSGMHHPEGMLWVRTPERQHTSLPEPIPLVEVAPKLSRLLGIEPPITMRGAPSGSPSRRIAA
jgi:hypothetical protein